MMLDRSIPFFNTIMKHPGTGTAGAEIVPAVLPAPDADAIVLSPYRPGFETGWARLHTATGDFSSPAEAEAYFRETYLSRPDALAERGVFAYHRTEQRVVGACIAWRDPAKRVLREKDPNATVASVHWLAVDEAYQRMGVGRAVMTEILRIYARKSEAPVYLHTQPWSWKAILLYDSLGFRLQKTDTFSDYENQVPQAMETLAAFSEKHPELLKPDALARVLARAE